MFKRVRFVGGPWDGREEDYGGGKAMEIIIREQPYGPPYTRFLYRYAAAQGTTIIAIPEKAPQRLAEAAL